MRLIQTLFFIILSHSMLSEIGNRLFLSLKQQKQVEMLIVAYFFAIFIFLKDSLLVFLFSLIPCGIMGCFCFIYLKKGEEDFLEHLKNLLTPLESYMHQGKSFLSSWQIVMRECPSPRLRAKLQKLYESFKFQKEIEMRSRETENFIRDLRDVHLSPQPLKRIKNLQRKNKIEQGFKTKSRRILMQIRLQSLILSIFYFSLLIWTGFAYGTRYLNLMVFSFFIFFIGLLWIFKTGSRMKWTI